jgi:hypothetical protein
MPIRISFAGARVEGIEVTIRIWLCALLALLASGSAQAKSSRAPPCWADTANVRVCAAYNVYVSRRLMALAPRSSGLGPGWAELTFQLGDRGAIQWMRCEGSADAYCGIAKAMLAQAHFRAPPGPWARYGQRLQFH